MSNILHSQSERDPILAYVASNLRDLRQQRGYSQSLLAERSGISRRMIVAVENEQANLSLSSVDRLAAALGVALTDLLRPPGANDSRRIAAVAWRGDTADSSGVLLGSAPAGREAELWLWSLGEGERYPSETGSGSWHEMLLVIEGELVVEMAGKHHKVVAGDFLIFSSADAYTFVNAGVGTVRFARNVVL